MKCFYHSADLDGRCSGAIVKHKYPDCELYPINYGDEFPWDIITDPLETIFMVDFSLQPFNLMRQLANACHLTWIDHHVAAYEEYEKYGLPATVIYGVNKAACELTWEYLHSNPLISLPVAVKLLSLYDIWEHDKSPDILEFQAGLSLHITDPNKDMVIWNILLDNTWSEPGSEADRLICSLIKQGSTILKYKEQYNKSYISHLAFPTTLTDPNEPNKCYKVIACNAAHVDSKLFDSVPDLDSFDILSTFYYKPNQWTVSLYSSKKDINVGYIAKGFGGGGHKGAAGFQCTTLPYDDQII